MRGRRGGRPPPSRGRAGRDGRQTRPGRIRSSGFELVERRRPGSRAGRRARGCVQNARRDRRPVRGRARERPEAEARRTAAAGQQRRPTRSLEARFQGQVAACATWAQIPRFTALLGSQWQTHFSMERETTHIHQNVPMGTEQRLGHMYLHPCARVLSEAPSQVHGSRFTSSSTYSSRNNNHRSKKVPPLYVFPAQTAFPILAQRKTTSQASLRQSSVPTWLQV